MRILLIDDDMLTLLGLGRALHHAGFEISVAEDGVEGLALARSVQPDLIICDVMMPLLNGLQLKQQMNHDPELAHIPLLFLSGRASPKDIHYAMELGAEGYLIKPTPFSQILDKAKAIIKQHRDADG